MMERRGDEPWRVGREGREWTVVWSDGVHGMWWKDYGGSEGAVFRCAAPFGLPTCRLTLDDG